MKQGIKNLWGPKSLLVLSVVYTLLMTIALLTPITDAPKIEFPFVDKMVHFIMNAALFIVWSSFILSKRIGFSNTHTLVLLFLGALFYGILIEVIQGSFVATRGADVLDVAANIFGLLFGLFVVMVSKKLI
ncbi:MAG: VanZ family protein [Saprospiraceae bacterium]|jgi:VanZ family protein